MQAWKRYASKAKTESVLQTSATFFNRSPGEEVSAEVSLECWLLLQMRAFLGQDLGGAFRCEAQLDEGRPDAGASRR